MSTETTITTIGDIVGDMVQVILKEPGELSQVGLDKPSMFLQVAGIDDVGLWVAHPNYVVVKVNDEEGKPLPPAEQEYRQVDANVLIRWEQIANIVHFPNREGYDFPNPLEKHIGFIIPSENEVPAEAKEEAP